MARPETKPAAKAAAAPPPVAEAQKPAAEQPPAAETKTAIALKPDERVRNQLAKMTDELVKALGNAEDVEKFKRVCATAIVNNKDLMTVWQEAPQTLFAACMKCAQDGLVPDGREAALVKYNAKREDGKGWMAIAQYMPMLQGLVKLVINTGNIADITIETVRENDQFDIELGDAPRFFHRPALKSRGDVIGAYSIVTYTDGTKSRQWMDVDAILAVKSRSKVQDGPWKTDFDQMACKTVFRRHCKKLGRSSERLDRALTADNAFFNYKDVLPDSAAGDGPHPDADKMTGKPKEAQQKPAAGKASRMQRFVQDRKKAPEPEPQESPPLQEGEIIEGHFTTDPGPPPERFNDDFDDIGTSAAEDDDDSPM